MQNPGQEPPASPKVPNDDSKDMDILCTFKIKTKSQKSESECIQDKTPYPNQGTPGIPQSPKSGLEGHVCYIFFDNTSEISLN